MARKKKTETGRIQLPKGKTANERAKEGAEFPSGQDRESYTDTQDRKNYSSEPSLQKFLVVSYDTDEQQWFYDIVYSESQEVAMERIKKLRPYVVDADVFDVAAVDRLYTAFQNQTCEESEKWMREIEAESSDGEEGAAFDAGVRKGIERATQERARRKTRS